MLHCNQAAAGFPLDGRNGDINHTTAVCARVALFFPSVYVNQASRRDNWIKMIEERVWKGRRRGAPPLFSKV